MNASKKPRRLPFLLGVLLLVTAGPVVAGTIVGTSQNEVLRGTAKADKLYGGDLGQLGCEPRAARSVRSGMH